MNERKLFCMLQGTQQSRKLPEFVWSISLDGIFPLCISDVVGLQLTNTPICLLLIRTQRESVLDTARQKKGKA